MGSNVFEQSIYGEVIPNGKTIDQVIPHLGTSLINDKRIFKKFEHCKSSLGD